MSVCFAMPIWLFGQIEMLDQLDIGVPNDGADPDRPFIVDLIRDVGLDVERCQCRFLRREPSGEIVLPLRREAVRHVDTQSVRELARCRLERHEQVGDDERWHVTLEHTEGRVFREASTDVDDSRPGEEVPSRESAGRGGIPENGGRVLTRRASDGETARRRARADFVDAKSLRARERRRERE
jgi:hypothetical protein